MDLEYRNATRSSENPPNRFFRRPLSVTATLSLPPIRRGKVRMGVGLQIYGIKDKSHPLPTPLPPDGRGGGLLNAAVTVF